MEFIPARDIAVTDNHVLTLGNTEITLCVTLQGRYQVVFSTTVASRPWSASGAALGLCRTSWRSINAEVDALIVSHIYSNSGVQLETIRANSDGATPYVIGEAAVQCNCGVLNEGTRVHHAPNRLNLSAAHTFSGARMTPLRDAVSYQSRPVRPRTIDGQGSRSTHQDCQ